MMRPRLVRIPLFPWRARALWPNVIAYRWGARITIQQVSREMVRLADMQFFGMFHYWLRHALKPGLCRKQRHNWESVHYSEAMEVLRRHGFDI